MVTDLLNDAVVYRNDGHDRDGGTGTIRGIYLSGSTIMAIVEWDSDHSLGTVDLVELVTSDG